MSDKTIAFLLLIFAIIGCLALSTGAMVGGAVDTAPPVPLRLLLDE